jgi:DNA-directed RNA polymerase specialized sigma24 family protein
MAASPRCGRMLTVAEGRCPVDHPPERFARLYDQYYRNVLRYALQHAEQGSAEDVASEVFLITWRRLPDVPEPPLPRLLGVARNLLRQQAGSGRRRQLLADRIAALTSAEDTTAWDAGEHVVERQSALDVLTSLPERDLEALTLVTWHGLAARAQADRRAAGAIPAQRGRGRRYPADGAVRRAHRDRHITRAQSEEPSEEPAAGPGHHEEVAGIA